MGTKIINKYYKGVLECQFEIKDSNGPNDASINKLIDTIGKIELTERFWFREVQEIKEIEYQTFLNNKEDCILIHPENQNYSKSLSIIENIKDKYNIIKEL